MLSTKSVVVTALVALITLATSSATPAFGRGSISSIFAVPRGGGLFGGKDKESPATEDSDV